MTRHVGAPMKRKEDRRFVTGAGVFTDDIALPRQAHAAVVRAAHAHARIRRIDTAAARSMPGVLLVLTAWRCERRDRSRHSLVLPDAALRRGTGAGGGALPAGGAEGALRLGPWHTVGGVAGGIARGKYSW